MAIINGNDRSEIIDGTNRGDLIDGNGGNDLIWGYDGNDDIHGGTGDDVIRGGSGSDDLWGDTGVNDLFGGSGADVFHMSTRGNAASDDWVGDFQFDVDRIDVSRWGISDFTQIKALLHDDDSGSAWFNASYNGRDHFLTIDGVAPGELIAADFIFSKAGAQSVVGTGLTDTLFGSRFNDAIDGSGGNDTVLGGIGDDVLAGRTGNDNLLGGAGADRLIGNIGRDVLTGNGGNDIFDFNLTTDSNPVSGQDLITDYHRHEDVIDLAGIDANTVVAGNQAFAWIGAADFSAAGQLRYYFSGQNTVIQGSVDGDSDAEFQFVIDARFTPGTVDFIL